MLSASYNGDMEIILQLEKTNLKCSTIEGLDGQMILSRHPDGFSNQFIKLFSGENFNFLPQKYEKMAQHFASSSQVSPLMVPRHVLQASIDGSVNVLRGILDEDKNKNYAQHWIKIHEFLQSLCNAKINSEELNKIIAEHSEINNGGFESFRPNARGFAKKIKYNMLGTVTGRLTVESGPQILTTHKSVRRCITSSFEDGSIFEIDFKSIEPRLAMVTAGIDPPDDVYQELLNEFPQLGRKNAKLVTLTALYGGQANRITETIGDISVARKAVAFVRSHFRVDKMDRMLEKMSEDDLVRNVLGRPLREATKNPRIRVNHYLQSSAAEVSILIFKQICDLMGEAVRPLFVVHDALIFDVAPGNEEDVAKIIKSANFNGTKMPMNLTRLDNTYDHAVT